MLPLCFSRPDGDLALRDLPPQLRPEDLLPAGEGAPAGPWEVEIGFGKGRYLLRRAMAEPGNRFLGIEVVSKYQKMLSGRARRRGLPNLTVIRGEAVYLLSAVLPRAFARAVHVYFPDPWPKSRHHKRRLFHPEQIDLVLGLLEPGGTLLFATDFLDYGAIVQEILESHPGLEVHPHPEVWPDGARTNYEAKYIEEGRPILRLTATLVGEGLHPLGWPGIVGPAKVEGPAPAPASP
jgi:tRNA (guanine-N7-)-methyltransferase